MKDYSKKELKILDAAEQLFAQKPFHKVLLDDVARSAGVGKGTLYLYFKNKDDLFFSVMLRGFSEFLEQLRPQTMDMTISPISQVKNTVKSLCEHMLRKAPSTELMGRVIHLPKTEEWEEKRQELFILVSGVIERGIVQGVFANTDPHMAAMFIVGLCRSTYLYSTVVTDKESLVEYASSFALKALTAAE